MLPVVSGCKAAVSSETLVLMYQTIWRHILEDHNVEIQRRENQKCETFWPNQRPIRANVTAEWYKKLIHHYDCHLVTTLSVLWRRLRISWASAHCSMSLKRVVTRLLLCVFPVRWCIALHRATYSEGRGVHNGGNGGGGISCTKPGLSTLRSVSGNERVELPPAVTLGPMLSYCGSTATTGMSLVDLRCLRGRVA